MANVAACARFLRWRRAGSHSSVGLFLILCVALLACRKTHLSVGDEVDPSRGGFCIHEVDDQIQVLDPPEPCPGIELKSENVRSNTVPVRFL
jgi:hypothetical protein